MFIVDATRVWRQNEPMIFHTRVYSILYSYWPEIGKYTQRLESRELPPHRTFGLTSSDEIAACQSQLVAIERERNK